jgi:signal transduction histidine kinase
MTKVANESYELIRAMLAVLQVDQSVDPFILFSRYGDQMAERSAFQVDIIHQGKPRELSPNQNRQLFFIFREALSNIEKHASPNRATCTFEWGEQTLTLVISDDGLGFDPDHEQSSGHYGLIFMRQRTEVLNGSFSIQSAVGKGTTITVNLPYEEGLFSESQK